MDCRGGLACTAWVDIEMFHPLHQTSCQTRLQAVVESGLQSLPQSLPHIKQPAISSLQARSIGRRLCFLGAWYSQPESYGGIPRIPRIPRIPQFF